MFGVVFGGLIFLRAYVWTACFMYFATGLATVILGGILPTLLIHYHLSYANGGVFVFAQFAGFLAGVPLASYILHRFGYKPVLVVGAAAIAIALCSATFLPPVNWLYGLCMLSGFGIATTETGVATYTMEAFVDRRAVVMSYLEVAFGSGALFMPALSSLLLTRDAWQWSFGAAGLAALFVTVAWIALPLATVESHIETAVIGMEGMASAGGTVAAREQAEARQGAVPSGGGGGGGVGMSRAMPSDVTGDVPTVSAGAPSPARRRWLLGLFLAMIFLYVGVESSVSSFFPSIFIPYFHEVPAVASLSVATFWAAMVLGRGATGWVVQRVSYGKFLFWSIAGTIGLFVSLAFTDAASLAYVEVFILGLCMSGIFSITLVFANHAIPGAARLVTSLVTVFAGLGGAIIPPLTGFTLDHATPESAIWAIAGFATLLFIGLLGVQRRVLVKG